MRGHSIHGSRRSWAAICSGCSGKCSDEKPLHPRVALLLTTGVVRVTTDGKAAASDSSVEEGASHAALAELEAGNDHERIDRAGLSRSHRATRSGRGHKLYSVLTVNPRRARSRHASSTRNARRGNCAARFTAYRCSSRTTSESKDRMATHGGQPRSRAQRDGSRCAGDCASASSGRHHPGEDEPQRIGERARLRLHFQLEWRRGALEESVLAGSQLLRIVGRCRGVTRRKPRTAGCRDRDRRLHYLSRFDEQPRWPQAPQWGW